MYSSKIKAWAFGGKNSGEGGAGGAAIPLQYEGGVFFPGKVQACFLFLELDST